MVSKVACWKSRRYDVVIDGSNDRHHDVRPRMGNGILSRQNDQLSDICKSLKTLEFIEGQDVIHT